METIKNSKVTVVDDDLLVCEALTETIQSWGLRAESFTHPEAALDSLRERKSDIILLDLFMSHVYGLDMIPQFGCDLKIIVITGFADKDSAIRALRAGAFDLLEKPFQNELLYHSISTAIAVLKTERQSKELMEELEQSRMELLTSQRRLENMNAQLFETNNALSVLARNIAREKEELEGQIGLRLRNLLMPTVMKLRGDKGLGGYAAQLDMLTWHLEDLTSGSPINPKFVKNLSSSEMRIASLVKSGIKTEEIARQLCISVNTVRSHRSNIRKKLKIDGQYNLRNFLSSLSATSSR